MARKAKARSSTQQAANLGFEAKLWLAADKLRSNMDAAEYKHVVLGLIFLKYISDAFHDQHNKLLEGQGEGADPEDPDEYKAVNVFWVPAEARWSHLQANAKQKNIGKLVDDAMVAIERENPRLKGVLPKDYARPALLILANRGFEADFGKEHADSCRNDLNPDYFLGNDTKFSNYVREGDNRRAIITAAPRRHFFSSISA